MTTTTAPATLDTWTWGFIREWSEAEPYLLQRIFGSLVKVAAPVVVEYHGDLFHDAFWLKRTVTGPVEFWFSVRPSGTHIGTFDDPMWLDSVRRSFREATVMRCALTCDGLGHWTFTVTELAA